MDDDKTYIKFPGKDPQEITNWIDSKTDNGRELCYQIVPPKPKSLEEEVAEEMCISVRELSSCYSPTAALCRVLEKRFEREKEGK